MYNVKLLKLEDNAEWTNPDPMSGAGPNVAGSALKRRCYVEIHTATDLYSKAEILTDEPFSPEGFAKSCEELLATLPQRNEYEGIEARKEDGKLAVYKDGAKLTLKEDTKPVTKG